MQRVRRVKAARAKGREDYLSELDAVYYRLIRKHREEAYIDDLEAVAAIEEKASA